MQASMLFVPSGARVPGVGEDIDVRVRFTATDFDRVVISLTPVVARSPGRAPHHGHDQPGQAEQPGTIAHQ